MRFWRGISLRFFSRPQKGRRRDDPVVKKSAIVLLFMVFTCLGAAQEQPAQDPGVLQQFTRSGKFNGVTLFFVYMNNRTVEALFQAPTKYAMRARANMSTMMYVQGTPDKEASLNTDFVLEQDGQTTGGTAHNIKNFKAGTVPKGERIDGIIQFETKVNPSHPFTVRNADALVEFKLSPEALKLLEPQPQSNQKEKE
jgi:hypothetical protein